MRTQQTGAKGGSTASAVATTVGYVCFAAGAATGYPTLMLIGAVLSWTGRLSTLLTMWRARRTRGY